MKNTFIILCLTMLCSACVKLEIKPGKVVSDTIDAGKSAYQTVRRSRNGEEERVYSHSVPYNAEATNAENIANCKAEVVEIIEASSLTLTKVLTESSEVNDSDGGKQVACSLTALVKVAE